MKDLYIEDFIDGKIIFENSSKQRALNWVKLGNKQIYLQYGVEYSQFINSQAKNYQISINALANFVQQELSKNFIYCAVTPANTRNTTEIFNIEVYDGI